MTNFYIFNSKMGQTFESENFDIQDMFEDHLNQLQIDEYKELNSPTKK
jgi:hypothetical protein